MITETVDKPRTFALLRQKGIVKVVIEFSGGNDEGGADSTAAQYADGSTAELPPSNAYSHSDFDRATQQWGPAKWIVWLDKPDETGSAQRDATPEEIEVAELNELLEAPVYATYGSFAGEFYVNGTVTWDVTAQTVHMERDEQVYSSTDAGDVDF